MTRPLSLNDEAIAELDAAIAWLRASSGSARDFMIRIDAVLDQIAAMPETHRVVLDDIRRAIVPKTPYSIYYRVHPDRVEVVSVFHGSRDPDHWQRRG